MTMANVWNDDDKCFMMIDNLCYLVKYSNLIVNSFHCLNYTNKYLYNATFLSGEENWP